MTIYTNQCSVCGTEFTTINSKSKYCGVKCKQDTYKLSARNKKRIKNEEKYKDVHDIPICEICGWKSASLSSHITQFHKLSVQEYKDMFNLDNSSIFHSSYIQPKRDRMIGENNPGYQHGGTMSSFSKNSIKYEGLTEEEKEQKIRHQVTKSHNTQRENNNYSTTTEYYTSRGFTLEEAKDIISKRQSTFSLAICIEKYGEELGKQRWLDRQEKWLNSDGVKQMKSGVSKISQEMFASLYSKLDDDIYFFATNGELGVNNEYILVTETGIVKLDFFAPTKKRIIEFDGDYWHDDNPGKKCSVIRDAKILNTYPDYKILHIWESEYRQNKQGTIERCLQFLNN